MVLCIFSQGLAQYPAVENELDKKVKAFLKDNAENWGDMNIPINDGKILYDIIVENNFKNSVEIGTSTGHSAIWIAWALSKTGGRSTKNVICRLNRILKKLVLINL
jgi:predicted O-methyltransferase YrrM